MKATDYRIESSHAILFRLWPAPAAVEHYFSDGALAVAMAAKSITIPAGEEIRVVHVPTGEVIFRKSTAATLMKDDT